MGGKDVHGDFTDEARKGKFEEKEIGRPLVSSDFSESYGAGFITVGPAMRERVTG